MSACCRQLPSTCCCRPRSYGAKKNCRKCAGRMLPEVCRPDVAERMPEARQKCLGTSENLRYADWNKYLKPEILRFLLHILLHIDFQCSLAKNCMNISLQRLVPSFRLPNSGIEATADAIGFWNIFLPQSLPDVSRAILARVCTYSGKKSPHVPVTRDPTLSPCDL